MAVGCAVFVAVGSSVGLAVGAGVLAAVDSVVFVAVGWFVGSAVAVGVDSVAVGRGVFVSAGSSASVRALVSPVVGSAMAAISPSGVFSVSSPVSEIEASSSVSEMEASSLVSGSIMRAKPHVHEQHMRVMLISPMMILPIRLLLVYWSLYQCQIFCTVSTGYSLLGGK